MSLCSDNKITKNNMSSWVQPSYLCDETGAKKQGNNNLKWAQFCAYSVVDCYEKLREQNQWEARGGCWEKWVNVNKWKIPRNCNAVLVCEKNKWKQNVRETANNKIMKTRWENWRRLVRDDAEYALLHGRLAHWAADHDLLQRRRVFARH